MTYTDSKSKKKGPIVLPCLSLDLTRITYATFGWIIQIELLRDWRKLSKYCSMWYGCKPTELMQTATWYAFCRNWLIGNAVTSIECFNTLAHYNSTSVNTYELTICIYTDTNTNSHSSLQTPFNLEHRLGSIPSAWDSTRHYCYYIVYTFLISTNWSFLGLQITCVNFSIPLYYILSLLMEYLTQFLSSYYIQIYLVHIFSLFMNDKIHF